MKSYQQYCSVARALDLVGDRWVLLIVRELLTWGPSRYSDLKRGLPGVASNLLADRLRTMEADGLVERYDAPPPVGSALYRLTRRGAELKDVVHALSRWGIEEMTGGPHPGDAEQPQWMALLAGLELSPEVSPGDETVIGVQNGGQSVHVVLRHDSFDVHHGTSPAPEVALAGESLLVGAVLSGTITYEEGMSRGLQVSGDVEALANVLGRIPTRRD